MFFIRFILILLITSSSLNAKTINLGSVLNHEPLLKGENLKKFLTDHRLVLSRGGRNILFEFQGKTYAVIENEKIVQKGTWKMSLLKKTVRLKPSKGKSFYFKILKNKPIIFYFNGNPGKEGVKKTTYKITKSSKTGIQTLIASYSGSALNFDQQVKANKNKLNKVVSGAISSTLGFSEQMGQQFGTTTEVSHYFFQASENYLRALELLNRAYENNTEADKIFASLAYMQNSKISEAKRLNSTTLIINQSHEKIKSKIQDSSHVFSQVGRSYYEKALPYAFAAMESTGNLANASLRAIDNIKSNTGSDMSSMFAKAADTFSLVNTATKMPKFVANMRSTLRLVFSGAKEKKIRDNGNLNKALDELNLD